MISQNPFLKNLAETGKLIAFADDLFIIADNKVGAEDALKACDLLKNYGLHINLKKTQIMTDREDIDGVEEICSVKIVEKIRYLGIYLYCDRPKLLESVKAQVKKYIGYVKLKIRSNNLDLVRLIFSAFYRSMLIYYLTPVYAAAAINEEDINKLETQIIRE